MARPSLATLRTSYLNDKLGLSSDADNSFGTTTQRNARIQEAIRHLWPSMGRPVRRTLTTTSADEYNLTTLAIEVYEILHITLLDSSGLREVKVPSWRLWRDEGTDPPTFRLSMPKVQSALTAHLYGYVPYLVPADASALCDLPDDRIDIAIAGARYESYRWKLSTFANYEAFQNDNRDNSLSVGDLRDLMHEAKDEYDRLMREAGVRQAMPRRAISTVR